jgi:hypothetical protein
MVGMILFGPDVWTSRLMGMSCLRPPVTTRAPPKSWLQSPVQPLIKLIEGQPTFTGRLAKDPTTRSRVHVTRTEAYLNTWRARLVRKVLPCCPWQPPHDRRRSSLQPQLAQCLRRFEQTSLRN